MIDLVPYEQARHAAYLFGTMRRALAGYWPWAVADWGKIQVDLTTAIGHPEILSRVAEPSDDPTTFLGVSVIHPGEILWCYVSYPFRRQGLGTRLCEPAGENPLVRYWTPATVRIARQHKRPLRWGEEFEWTPSH